MKSELSLNKIRKRIINKIDRIYPRLFSKNYRSVHLQYLVLRKAAKSFHN